MDGFFAALEHKRKKTKRERIPKERSRFILLV